MTPISTQHPASAKSSPSRPASKAVAGALPRVASKRRVSEQGVTKLYDSVLVSPSVTEQRGAQISDLARRIQSLLKVVDAQRANDIVQAHIAAAIPLQAGAFEQAELVGQKAHQALAHIPLLTARQVAQQTGSVAARPETLTAQWLSRRQIFGVDLAGHGVRFPAFQFQPSGQPWPALKQALPTLLNAFSPLHLLLWFDTPHPALAGKAPMEMLHNPLALMQAIHHSTAPIDIF